jgi:O-antigen/teichoic acid export membrane protein
MSLVKRVVSGSAIYSATTFLQKGISFLLLPLYTRYLTPDDYGILAVVGSLTSLLAIFSSLSLHGAVSRFYFAYREYPDVLKEFWGTILTLVLLASIVAAAIFFVIGKIILAPVYGSIAFYPYVAIGIATAMLQPVSTIFLAILQAREEARRYALHSLIQFGLTVGLVVSLVVCMGWNATGPLLAGLVTALAYFFVSLYLLKDEYRFCLNRQHLRVAFGYSLPLVPHSLASQVAAAADRFFLNSMVSTASAGLYNIGAVFGGIMAIVADGVNRAYVPVSMECLESGKHDRFDEMAKLGLLIVAALSLAASLVSLFSKEVIVLLTGPAFHGSYVVVPCVAFSFVFAGIYYLFVNILFFHVGTTKVVAIGSVAGAIFNVALNYFLVKIYGLMGAAIATLLGQLAATFLIGVIGRRYDPIGWNYKMIGSVPIVCLGAVLIVNALNLESALVFIGVKIVSFTVLFIMVNVLIWRDPMFMTRWAQKLIKRQMEKPQSPSTAAV